MGGKQSKAGHHRSNPKQSSEPSCTVSHSPTDDGLDPAASSALTPSKERTTGDEHEKKKKSIAKREGSFSESRMTGFFEAYADADSGDILAEGVERLCHDLDVEPTDLAVLAWAWKCEVKEACVFSREEFFRGCRLLRADRVKVLKASLPKLVQELNDEEKFSSLYHFAFGFGLDKNETRLPADMAVNLWRLLFSKRPRPFLEQWCQFCLEYNNLKISKDTWSMFLHFTKTIKPDFSNFDEDSAWPNVIDEFVEAQLQKCGR